MQGVFYNFAQRLVHVVGADFGERSCPKDTELRCENPQLAYHRTPPCNMYCVTKRFFILSKNLPVEIQKFCTYHHISQLLRYYNSKHYRKHSQIVN